LLVGAQGQPQVTLVALVVTQWVEVVVLEVFFTKQVKPSTALTQ
jgi:hypothetical protein